MKTRVMQQDPRDEKPKAPPDSIEPPASPPRSGARTSGQSRAGTPLSRVLVFVLLVVLVLSCSYLATTPGSSDISSNGDSVSTGEFAAIDAYIEGEMSAQRIPGLSLGIVREGRTVHQQGFGEADASGRDVTPQTPFIIGSLSKSFTAVAIMQLVEAGQVDLDAPVRQYLPGSRSLMRPRRKRSQSDSSSTTRVASPRRPGRPPRATGTSATRRSRAPSASSRPPSSANRSVRPSNTAPSTTRCWVSSSKR